ncbi:hypothetical protein PPYR_12891 [Photinus pyralis]|uniref:Uncharacterized protein n=1 Tax=Photinus pyralis TaxID=7054 RepID=A0A5N4A7G9_PHOPY|nr:hypothetical protein PPYR_12891 [Photinus pyralis]
MFLCVIVVSNVFGDRSLFLALQKHRRSLSHFVLALSARRKIKVSDFWQLEIRLGVWDLITEWASVLFVK